LEENAEFTIRNSARILNLVGMRTPNCIPNLQKSVKETSVQKKTFSQSRPELYAYKKEGTLNLELDQEE
jgi:hypothetical protein